MVHIAIMNKKKALISKIVSGEKTIESRWYVSKIAPWDRIKKEETIYFKESGGLVTAKALVKDVLQFDGLNESKIFEILNKYGKQIGFQPTQHKKWARYNSNKKYCILIFLEKPQYIEPFKADKTGFGTGCAWMCIENIEKVRTKD